MEKIAAEKLISELYEHVLERQPTAAEYATWVEQLVSGLPPERAVSAFFRSKEFQTKKEKKGVDSTFPMGHFYSPVVDPGSVRNYVDRERQLRPEQIAGIPLDIESMRNIWLRNLPFIQSSPFTDKQNGDNRYYYTMGYFPPGDAITLRMMIGNYKPKRIIEIGSGSSSACMLDAAEHAALHDFSLTCIEPFPDRLRALLRESDRGSTTIIERQVQDVPSAIVNDLEPNDILFIDSTHVLKTGSDVHYELFHLLPLIKPGVIVHFHDILYPFEYHDQWIFEKNFSWNEAYALRAFLMYNTDFRVLFWNPLFALSFASSIRDEFPIFLTNPGGSIWLERSTSRASAMKPP
jgi:predicted O-methyltransferase YrrM